MRRYVIIVFMLLALSACREDDTLRKDFQKAELVSLEINGKFIVEYMAQTSQLAYSAERREFRLQDDKSTKYYDLKLDKLPESEGQSLKGKLVYSDGSRLGELSNVTFHVEKIGADGNIWLWNTKHKAGVIVRKI